MFRFDLQYIMASMWWIR